MSQHTKILVKIDSNISKLMFRISKLMLAVSKLVSLLVLQITMLFAHGFIEFIRLVTIRENVNFVQSNVCLNTLTVVEILMGSSLFTIVVIVAIQTFQNTLSNWICFIHVLRYKNTDTLWQVLNNT